MADRQKIEPGDRRTIGALLRRIEAARRFPDNTDPCVRHVQIMGETLGAGLPYPMLDEERGHCAISLLSVVADLYEARNAGVPPSEVPSINYEPLYVYATGRGLDYNELCKVVRAACGVPPSEVPSSRTLPHPGSAEASAMLDSLLAEYNYPTNTKNAARAGWEAAERWLRTRGVATSEGMSSEAQDAARWRWLVKQHNTSDLPIAQVVWKRGSDPKGEWVNLIDWHDLTRHVDAALGVPEVCRFPDCKCPMDPGPEPDWCAKGLPHAPGVKGTLPTSSDPAAMWDRFVAFIQQKHGYNEVKNVMGGTAQLRRDFIAAQTRGVMVDRGGEQ